MVFVGPEALGAYGNPYRKRVGVVQTHTVHDGGSAYVLYAHVMYAAHLRGVPVPVLVLNPVGESVFPRLGRDIVEERVAHLGKARGTLIQLALRRQPFYARKLVLAPVVELLPRVVPQLVVIEHVHIVRVNLVPIGDVVDVAIPVLAVVREVLRPKRGTRTALERLSEEIVLPSGRGTELPWVHVVFRVVLHRGRVTTCLRRVCLASRAGCGGGHPQHSQRNQEGQHGLPEVLRDHQGDHLLRYS